MSLLLRTVFLQNLQNYVKDCRREIIPCNPPNGGFLKKNLIDVDAPAWSPQESTRLDYQQDVKRLRNFNWLVGSSLIEYLEYDVFECGVQSDAGRMHV
jgi:hypothetical protein